MTFTTRDSKKMQQAYEIIRLSNRKDSRDRSKGNGRRFKLDAKDRFLVLLVYCCRLYITCTLAGFLFDLDQSNICSDMQKIELLVRKCVPIHQKICRLTKRLRTPQEAERHFPGFIAFTGCTEQQIPRPINNTRRKMYYSGKKKSYTLKNQLMVNNQGVIIHKTKHKKGHRHDYDIYKKNYPVTQKEVINVFDLGYRG